MQKLLRSPPDDSGLRKFEARNQAPIDEHVAGRQLQRGQRAAARGHRGPINIEAIDFVDLGDADADRDGAVADRREQFFALFVAQLFGIVHAADECLGREDHRGGHDGTGHRADAGFVNTGDGVDAEFPQAPFVAQVGPLAHRDRRCS